MQYSGNDSRQISFDLGKHICRVVAVLDIWFAGFSFLLAMGFAREVTGQF
jgi:hypothetical protein